MSSSPLEEFRTFGPGVVPESQAQQPKQPPELPPSRVYDASGWRSYGYAAQLMMVVGQTGLLLLQLQSSSWWFLLIAEVPLYLAANSAWAAALVSATRPKCPVAAFWVFASMTIAPGLILTGLGMADLVFVSQCAALVLWFVVFCPTAGNAPLGLVSGLLCSALQLGLLICAVNIVAIRSAMPPLLRGFVMPVVVMVYEGVTTILASWGWQRFYTRDVPLQLFNILAALAVQSAEGVRLVAFLTASLHQEDSDVLLELAVGTGLSVCTDILYRSLIVERLLCSAAGRDHEVTPEYDAFLRARFEYGYTSFIHAAGAALVLALHGAAWAAQPMFWASLAAGLAQEVLTDAAFVFLHWWTARRAESPKQTLQRLLAPGGHRVLFLDGEPRVRRFEVEDGTEGAGLAEAEMLDAGGVSLPLGAPLQLLIAHMARETAISALRGNFGSCTDWFSEQLCLAMQ